MLGPAPESRHGPPPKGSKNAYTDYLANVEFENIKNLWIWRHKVETKDYEQYRNQGKERLDKWRFSKQFENVILLIQLDRPCSTLKFGPQMTNFEVYEQRVEQERQEKEQMLASRRAAAMRARN